MTARDPYHVVLLGGHRPPLQFGNKQRSRQLAGFCCINRSSSSSWGRCAEIRYRRGGHKTTPSIGSRARDATALRVRLGTDIGWVLIVYRLNRICVGRVVTHLVIGAGSARLTINTGDWVGKECNYRTRTCWRRRVHRPNQVLMEIIMTGNPVLPDFRDLINLAFQYETTIQARP